MIKMAIIYRFNNGRKIREATAEEYSRYLAELAKKPKNDQLSGEVQGENYGLTGLIYMQDLKSKITSESNELKCEITYYIEGGRKNSEKTLKLAKERAIERGIKDIVIASIRGQTALKALEIFRNTDIKLTICTCNACNGCDRFSKEIWRQVEDAGHRVVYTNEDATPFPQEAVLAYRRICEGMKVCVQLSMAVVDQGIIPSGTEIIAIGGTGGKSYGKGWGVDTAIVIEAVGSTEFFSHPKTWKEHKLHARKIKEIICMPR
jgi:hypothetical protein